MRPGKTTGVVTTRRAVGLRTTAAATVLALFGCTAPDRTADYIADFESIRDTVAATFPAFDKKGIDWQSTCARHAPRIAAADNDRAHIANVCRLLAELRDTHTSLRKNEAGFESPMYDGLGSGGIWLAHTDDGQWVIRAVAAGHPSTESLPVGSRLLTINDTPMADHFTALRRRLTAWRGWSSDHFLVSVVGTRFFDFSDSRSVAIQLVTPGGAIHEVSLPADAPPLDRRVVSSPPTAEINGLATSVRLDDRLGYIRILGKMNEATVEAFFASFDRLRGAAGIVLDCREMGGGGDGPALAIAGRFFETRTENGSFSPIVPTGNWQFAGPVVMLQDESEVSSAETFTWSLTETGRVLAVGRHTGGATLIPRVFDLPSGLGVYRVGKIDRATPIRGIQPEGVGTAPDVWVRYAADSFRSGDPVLRRGIACLQALIAGASHQAVIDRFGDRE